MERVGGGGQLDNRPFKESFSYERHIVAFCKCFVLFSKMSAPASESTLAALFQGLLGASEFPPHVHLFDCLRAISGNQVLHSQELPCNNYGVKWHLATQEGICPLAAPFSCSAAVRGHKLFRKSPFLKRPETGGVSRQPCLLKQQREVVGALFQLDTILNISYYCSEDNNLRPQFIGY